jgi:DNA-binding IscR family transcriptional regulator
MTPKVWPQWVFDAIRIVMWYAQHAKGKYVTTTKLMATKTLADLPPRTVTKITRFLRIAGILQSGRGPDAGFKLAQHPSDITLYDVHIAVSKILAQPIDKQPYLDRRVVAAYQHLSTYFQDSLKRITIADVIHKEHG